MIKLKKFAEIMVIMKIISITTEPSPIMFKMFPSSFNLVLIPIMVIVEIGASRNSSY